MSMKFEVRFSFQNKLFNKTVLKSNNGKDNILEKYNCAQQYKCNTCNTVFYIWKICNEDDVEKNYSLDQGWVDIIRNIWIMIWYVIGIKE